METTLLGRTGLEVSVAGLGCGGNSRLGLGRGLSADACADVVRAALDHGINFLDTAEAYGTEEIVGAAIQGRARDRVVLSSKARLKRQGVGLTPQQVIESLEESLQRMKVDCIDVFHLHAVTPDMYDFALHDVVPELERARTQGKLKHIGITETGPVDPEQKMLSRAIHDSPWEVMMLAFSMMNQQARKSVFPITQERKIGTLLMFVVRNIFSQTDRLAADLKVLADEGKIPQALATTEPPLSFVLGSGGAETITEAAYRYARHQPGADVVLFGTGSIDHLKANIEALSKPPLPRETVALLETYFGDLVGVGLDLPDHVAAARKA